MKKYLFYLSMALVAVVLFSCKSGKKSVFTPTSSGRAYEVLVVVEKPVWERPAGRALYNVLDTDVPGLPQSERSFRIMSTSPKDFDAILKLVRNIIIVDIQDIYTQPKFKYAKDVYASPQMILTIQTGVRNKRATHEIALYAPQSACFHCVISMNINRTNLYGRRISRHVHTLFGTRNISLHH